MTLLETTVRKARSRLTINHWFNHVCVAMMAGAGAFAIIAVLVRLFGWNAPLGALALALAVGAIISSITWSVATRMDLPTAAAALDEAAGFRERISSGLYCSKSEDAFEKAVLADAQRVSASVTVSRHIKLRRPTRMASASMAILVASASLLIPSGVLVPAEADDLEDKLETERTVVLIRKQTEKIKRIARTNPALQELADDLDKLDESPGGQLRRPGNAKNLALKKLDRLSDALKQRRDSDRFQQAKELKKMLRSLKPPDDKNSPVAKLADALARGDFKGAREQLQSQQKVLSELAKGGDPKRVQAVQQQMENLARQLEKLAQDEKLSQKLQQSGLKKEDIERMMKNLTAEDIDRAKKTLQEQGLSQQAISKLMQKLQQQAGARQLAGNLAQALQQACASCAAGNPGQGAKGLEGAVGQLSELEMLEQELQQIDSMLAESRCAKGNLCNAGKNAGRSGMGNTMTSGRGGIARETQTATSFVKRRQKVKITRGAIIGQYLVDGEQYKGDITPALQELVTASESDATDAIDRARIPRRYHKAVKNYFSDIQEELTKAQRPTRAKPESVKGENTSDPVEE